jgi:hypothetical protein
MKDVSNTDGQEENPEKCASTISLSTPWSITDGSNYMGRASLINSIGVPSEETEEFIRLRSQVHMQYIIEENKTKRLALVTSVALVIAGGVILVYGPAANRVLADLVGISLIVAAGGAAGFKRLWFRSSRRSFAADAGQTSLPAPSRRSKSPKT